jgi:Holliday junction resolvase RusA-like endonuclease
MIEDLVVFTVPGLIPCSVNHIWDETMYTGRDGYAHRGRKLSKQAIAFKHAVAIFARGRTVAPETDRERKKAKYRIKIDVYFGPRQKGDADNFLKNAIDSLVYAGVIHSDVNVVPTPEVHRDERHNINNPRTQYIVERL